MKAVCIVRPTSENVNALCERISGSLTSYGEFHVFFTNTVDEHKLPRDCESRREKRRRRKTIK